MGYTAGAMNVPDARLERLPMFPLPEAWIFPGALLPLHIFEPRYVAMLRHCITQADHALAIASLKPGFERDYEGRPPVRSIVGAGLIVAAKETPQHTWNIVVRGCERLEIIEEYPPTYPFREIRARRLAPPAPMSDEKLYRRLRLLVARVAVEAPGAREALDLVLEQAQDPGALVNLLAAHVIDEPKVRRMIFEAGAVDDALVVAAEAISRLLLDVGTRDTKPGTLH